MFQASFAHYFGDSHRLLRDTARRFCREHMTPFADAWEEQEGFDPQLFPKAAAAGVLGVAFPECWGGGGGDVFHTIVIAEELLKCGATGAVVGLGSLEIALPPLLLLGTDEQKARFVAPVLAGKRIAALAITEPGTGSDVAGITTRAQRQDDGSYILSGHKTFITSGVCGQQFTVLARTSDDPHGGLSFFVVTKGMPGFRVASALKKTGWRSSDTALLAFDDVRVPADHRIGNEGAGFFALMKNFEGERLALAIQGCVLAELALREAYAYAKERRAFGKTLSGYQVTRHKLAAMATRVLAAKSMAYQCGDNMRAGRDQRFAVAMVKNFCSDVAQEVCYEAVQIFGGMGYMRECKVERWARDARLLPIGGGTTEIMNEIIAKGLAGGL